eukprot:TRINITY_DN11369_c0_g1_i1.p1 TRINITY_DN11369_c0_g1~~TRINITY_DN11369_c0_g1_i1.p1  ORF type:complete len:329 (-),score=117.80 TRINITY_DN11369_c0_g1_i1:1353-2339(-)
MSSPSSASPPPSSLTGSVLQQLIFIPWVQYPPFPRVPDLSDPAKFSFTQGEENFDLSNISHLFISSPVGTTDSTSRIGAWYMLPTKSSGRVEPLSSSDTVILYLHGNASNRAQPHRVALYKVFLAMGYYVLAIDYRGFGDSSPVGLKEETVVADARAALGWITSKLGEKVKVLVWGHSLGSSIASHMVADFDLETGGNSSVSGLVLESPFNNMKDEVMTFKAAKALQMMVDVGTVLQNSDLCFESDKWLPAVKCPVLMMHAEDDKVVPYNLATNLHKEAVDAGKENIRFVTFPGELGLGHTDLYLSDTLKEELTRFVEEVGKGLEGSS